MKTILKSIVAVFLLMQTFKSFGQCCAAHAGPNKTFCCTCVTIGGSPAATDTCPGRCDSILYRWKPTTGLNNPNIANPCASPSQTTTYTLTIYVLDTLTHDTCCTSTSTVKVTKTVNCCRISNPNTPSQVADEHINIYPNPAIQMFTIEIDHNLVGGSAEVYDINGKLVWQKQNIVGASKLDVDLSNSARGIYFVKVKDGNSEVFSKKIIVQ